MISVFCYLNQIKIRIMIGLHHWVTSPLHLFFILFIKYEYQYSQSVYMSIIYKYWYSHLVDLLYRWCELIFILKIIHERILWLRFLYWLEPSRLFQTYFFICEKVFLLLDPLSNGKHKYFSHYLISSTPIIVFKAP